LGRRGKEEASEEGAFLLPSDDEEVYEVAETTPIRGEEVDGGSSYSSDVPPAQMAVSDLNVLLVGESGLGKSTFVNTLFNKDVIPRLPSGASAKTLCITPYSEIRQSTNHQLRVTVYDTPGYGDDPNLLKNWFHIVDFIDEQNREYARRKRYKESFVDPRIDLCFYFCPPHRFKDTDRAFVALLARRTLVVPLLAKADAMTQAETTAHRAAVREQLERMHSFSMEEVANVFTVMGLGGGGHFPPAIIGYELRAEGTEMRRDYDGMRIRRYPWGDAEVDNPKHCDVTRIRESLLRSADFHRVKEQTSRRWTDFMNHDTVWNRMLGNLDRMCYFLCG